MEINGDLNIVIPIDDPLRAFSAPLPEAVFKANYRVLARASEEIFGRGMKAALLTGSRTAALAIADAGKKVAEEDGKEGDSGAASFLAEIRRITTILAPTDSGFDMLPVDQAIQAGKITAEDWDDVLGELCFFMLGSQFETRRMRAGLLQFLTGALNCSLTSLNCEDFAASLTTSKPEPTKKAKASSVPV